MGRKGRKKNQRERFDEEKGGCPEKNHPTELPRHVSFGLLLLKEKLFCLRHPLPEGENFSGSPREAFISGKASQEKLGGKRGEIVGGNDLPVATFSTCTVTWGIVERKCRFLRGLTLLASYSQITVSTKERSAFWEKKKKGLLVVTLESHAKETLGKSLESIPRFGRARWERKESQLLERLCPAKQERP